MNIKELMVELAYIITEHGEDIDVKLQQFIFEQPKDINEVVYIEESNEIRLL